MALHARALELPQHRLHAGGRLGVSRVLPLPGLEAGTRHGALGLAAGAEPHQPVGRLLRQRIGAEGFERIGEAAHGG